MGFYCNTLHSGRQNIKMLVVTPWIRWVPSCTALNKDLCESSLLGGDPGEMSGGVQV